MRALKIERGNADYPWDDFDPDWYADHNYGRLREDDQEILTRTRDFFTATAGTGSPPRGRGVDVGSGANLYPALMMLPFCDEVVLCERGAANRQWLSTQIDRGYDPMWDPFWEVLCEAAPYRQLADPRAALRQRAKVQYGDVFKLGRHQWDLGSMFFVAESLTSREREFRQALAGFVHSLRKGAPFAAGFMRNSGGYTVGSQSFPAVAVDRADVESCLSGVADVEEVASIEFETPLREGFQGMILALGIARGATS